MHRLFAWAFGRHCKQLHNADYEVCRNPICWIAGTLERYLWYGGDWTSDESSWSSTDPRSD